jgi:uncharacterized Zn-binding protein involved in type VI secretion
MGPPAAKQGDRVTAADTHLIQPPGPTSPIPVPGHVFVGTLDAGLSSDVNIMGKPAATVGSTATNTPAHVPLGGTFVAPPTNQARVIRGSATVFINGQAAARAGDTAETCNDVPTPGGTAPVGTVVAAGTVNIGG